MTLGALGDIYKGPVYNPEAGGFEAGLPPRGRHSIEPIGGQSVPGGSWWYEGMPEVGGESQGGGVMPGSWGAAHIIVAHGGEMVVPRGGADSTGRAIVIQFHVAGRHVADAILDGLNTFSLDPVIRACYFPGARRRLCTSSLVGMSPPAHGGQFTFRLSPNRWWTPRRPSPGSREEAHHDRPR